MTQIEQAIAQIEQLKEENKHKLGACAAQIAMEGHCKEEAYNEVIEILKTFADSAKNCKNLQEIVSEDLNMAAHKASKNPCCDNVFVVGAEKFKEGALWLKKQLLKDAIEIECKNSFCGGKVDMSAIDNKINGMVPGEKYKVIFVSDND